MARLLELAASAVAAEIVSEVAMSDFTEMEAGIRERHANYAALLSDWIKVMPHGVAQVIADRRLCLAEIDRLREQRQQTAALLNAGAERIKQLEAAIRKYLFDDERDSVELRAVLAPKEPT